VGPKVGMDGYWSIIIIIIIIIIMAPCPLSELKYGILNKIRRFGYWLSPSSSTSVETRDS
jgi:hypothetical protein